MIRRILLAGCLLLFSRDNSLHAAGIAGEGYGQSLRPLVSARQAASGGIALEDPWRRGSFVEMNSVLLTSGVRWYGAGYQGGFGRKFRLGGEAFVFTVPNIPRTTENSDGSFGGRQGTIDVVESGGRFLSQLTILDGSVWKAAVLGRVSGLVQQLPSSRNTGMAIEVGTQVRRTIGNGRALTGWCLLGPIGRGAQLGFSGQTTCGVGLLSSYRTGFLGRAEGFGVGVEGQYLHEGRLHGGLGGLYWFGRPDQVGVTFYLRTGIRHVPESALLIQPRGGLGVLWRNKGQWGFQFDYAVVPVGDLGVFHYASLGMRLPSHTSRSVPAPQPLQQAPPEVPRVELPETLPPVAPVHVPPPVPPGELPELERNQEDIYFCPACGGKAKVKLEVRSESVFSAILLDREARFVLLGLVEPKIVAPGTYEVVWDGKLMGNVPATHDLPYVIRITADDQTWYIKVIVTKPK